MSELSGEQKVLIYDQLMTLAVAAIERDFPLGRGDQLRASLRDDRIELHAGYVRGEPMILMHVGGERLPLCHVLDLAHLGIGEDG